MEPQRRDDYECFRCIDATTGYDVSQIRLAQYGKSWDSL